MSSSNHAALATYERADRAGFAELVNDVHREFGFGYDAVLDADLDDPGGHYAQIWILRQARDVVGCIALTPVVTGVCMIKRMYLAPSVRGIGWGRRLMGQALASARSQEGCVSVVVDTSSRQPAAVRLIELFGFKLEREDGESRYYRLNH